MTGEILMTNAMKRKFTLLTLVVAMLSSVSLFAQDQRSASDYTNDRYDGQWPQGEGILYSYKDGLIIGSFIKGKAEGKCVCYLPNGEVYWGDFKKGKATGNGRIYRDNGIVIAGQYKKGKYHGIDTLYRSNGTMMVAKFKTGKLKTRLTDVNVSMDVRQKPEYPRVDLKRKQEEFLKELELIWEERNVRLREKAGLISPRFQGGSVEDFALWVNSQVVYPVRDRTDRSERTVIVEFVVLKDGTVSDAHAVFGSDPVLNEAAVKAVLKSPKWTPGEQNGEPRNVRMSVPVVFTF